MELENLKEVDKSKMDVFVEDVSLQQYVPARYSALFKFYIIGRCCFHFFHDDSRCIRFTQSLHFSKNDNQVLRNFLNLNFPRRIQLWMTKLY